MDLTTTTTAAAGTMTATAGSTIIVQDDDNIEANASIAALIIATIAFFAAVAQLTQSIISAARGLPNCSSDVMGNWARATSRNFKWSEFRLQVFFESPVIFLAHYRNERVPVPGSPAWYADGTDDSRARFRLGPKPAPPPETTSSSTMSSTGKQNGELSARHLRLQERTHNVDNERVSWLKLLETIQKMEDMASAWERQQESPRVSSGHPDLVVWMQPKKRSFDYNPAVKKPYANTTICHIVELAAMLGLYWKLFDRDANKYRAEGNGSSLLGTRVDELGIVFVFEATGHPQFNRNRVIPTSALKEVCFGNVPTIFRPTDAASDAAIRGGPLPEQTDLMTLQFGSRQEIAQTLNLIGCNTATRLYYLREKKHIHLFPVTFEILGMLGRTLHLLGRPFTYLPNPTIFEWNRQSFSMRRMLEQFTVSLSGAIESFHVTVPDELNSVRDYATELLGAIPPSERDPLQPTHLELLHHTLSLLDELLLQKDKAVVLDVLRRHLQEVLVAINTPAEGSEASSAASSSTRSSGSPREISFDNLLDVPPEYREVEFMAMYFEEIRYRVISNTDDDAYGNNQAAEASRAIQEKSDKEEAQRKEYHRQSFQAASIRSMPLTGPSASGGLGEGLPPQQPARRSTDAPIRPPPTAAAGGTSTPVAGTRKPAEDAAAADPDPSPYQGGRDETSPKILTTQPTFRPPGHDGGPQPGKAPRPPRNADEVHRNSIWCILVLRMICWLLLHNFDKNDVQLSKSGLVGNRQPVYIM